MISGFVRAANNQLLLDCMANQKGRVESMRAGELHCCFAFRNMHIKTPILTRISHQVAMRMMKNNLFLSIYADLSKVSPEQTALGARSLVRNAVYDRRGTPCGCPPASKACSRRAIAPPTGPKGTRE